MKTPIFRKVSYVWQIPRRYLPFKFIRQTRLRPTRKGVSFEVAHMTDRFVLIQLTHTSQRENPPGPVTFLPIEWRFPALLVDSVPAERKPELRSPIAAILDKFDIISVGNKSRHELERLDKLAMTWTFVIEVEASPFVANLVDARWKRLPRR